MNIKSLSDKSLVEGAIMVAREERERLTLFLHHLKEINRRRLISAYKYKSLFEMTTKHFGYSEDEAYRRISAMRLLAEIPEVEMKINTGELSLTHLSLAQKHFRQEKKIQAKEIPLQSKVSVIEKICNTSVREAERITLSLSSSPEPQRPEKIRILANDKVELKLTISTKTQEKINILKGMLAHKHPDLSLGKLFDLLCDLGIQELNPSAAPQKRCVKAVSVVNPHQTISKAQIRREVFSKAQNRCENCGSGYALEVDHIQPKALGGRDSSENLRILCRSCNQRAAVRAFGVGKMDSYIE